MYIKTKTKSSEFEKKNSDCKEVNKLVTKHPSMPRKKIINCWKIHSSIRSKKKCTYHGLPSAIPDGIVCRLRYHTRVHGRAHWTSKQR